MTSTISSITSMRQRRHLPPLPHTQLTVNKPLKARPCSLRRLQLVCQCSPFVVDRELLRALLAIFIHILLLVLISFLILIKVGTYCWYSSQLFFLTSCVDSHGPGSFGALSVNRYNACKQQSVAKNIRTIMRIRT